MKERAKWIKEISGGGVDDWVPNIIAECWENEIVHLQHGVSELEAQLDKLQKAALEAVSWDWRILSMMPEFVDWAAVIRDMDALEKAIDFKGGE